MMHGQKNIKLQRKMTVDARPQSQWEFQAFLLPIKMAYKNSHFLSVPAFCHSIIR